MYLVLFVVFLIIGMPIAFALGVGAFEYYAFEAMLPIESLLNTMFSVTNSFTLMAIPFFILAGSAMNEGQLTVRLVNFSRSLVGHIRGSLGYVVILTSMSFAAMSGSAVASVSAIGTLLIPAMVDDGYNRADATALVSSSACIGPMIPPSIPMVIYATTVNVSVGAMLIAGAIPGVIMGILLGIIFFFQTRKRGYEVTDTFSWMKVWKALKQGLPALIMPMILFVGIFGGIFTVTEAAVISAVYSLLVGFFVTKEIKIKGLPKILTDSAITTASVMILYAMAGVFARVMTLEDIPQMITNLIMSISDSRTILLLLINGMLLITGMFLDLGAAVVILTPALLPVALELGMDPIHFGAMMCINLIIGFITPPVGCCLFVGTSVGQVSFEGLARSIWPYIIAGLILILIVTFIPQITIWLPSLVF